MFYPKGILRMNKGVNMYFRSDIDPRFMEGDTRVMEIREWEECLRKDAAIMEELRKARGGKSLAEFYGLDRPNATKPSVKTGLK
jgi:hypothetical protein